MGSGMMVFSPWYFVGLVKGAMVSFYSRVNGLEFMNSLTCIYIYCNLEKNIMKNQSGGPSFGIHGKIAMYICFMFLPSYIFFLRIRLQVISVQG